METKNIILFIILQCFIHVVFSQEIKDGFQISRVKSTTWFDDEKMSNFMGFPILNEKGEMIGDPSSKFSSKEKKKKIECELYSEEERNYMLTQYKPSAIVVVRAKDGIIVSVSFAFENLQDPSVIDTKKLQKLQTMIMDQIMYEDLLFNGEKAASGYLLASIWLFRP